MSRKIVRKTDEFTAESDDGQQYAIEEYTTFHGVTTNQGYSEVAGVRELRTSDGTCVSFKSAGVYEIFPYGPIVRRV